MNFSGYPGVITGRNLHCLPWGKDEFIFIGRNNYIIFSKAGLGGGYHDRRVRTNDSEHLSFLSA
jgi:hypothetical protein